jgi:uncharacterized protein (DUF1501 family)
MSTSSSFKPTAQLTRRKLLGSAALAPLAGTTSLCVAGNGVGGGPRLALVILRGGMDGLSAVPVPGDPSFAAARGRLAEFGAPALPLDGPFALHPALVRLHGLYQSKDAAIIHATGLPYRERSHFEAQQLLESGGERPYALSTGWLGRALSGTRGKGMALQTAVPLVLRGHAEVDSWTPSTLPDPSPDLLQRLERLYERDPALARALRRARQLRADEPMVASSGAPAGRMPMTGASPPDATGMAGLAGGAAAGSVAVQLARRAAEFLSQPAGPQAAVLELAGWDTHANQAAAQGPMASNLRRLDDALGALCDGLRAAPGLWERSAVVVMTEFGREVAINGTQGTDHGSGGAAFILGGRIRGGQVLADWPGLAPKDRFEGRDLRITTDLRSVWKTVLSRHLRVADSTLTREVLPGTAALPLLPLFEA